jgi:phosphoglycolate phosphatase
MAHKTIVFDLDGTLVDTAPDLTEATNAILTAHGRRPVSLDEVREMVGQGARKLIVRGFEATGEPLDEAHLEPLFQDFIDHYMANIAVHSRPYPGVLDLLDRCRASDHAMAICTNKLEAMSVKLIDELDLSHYFGAIVGPDTIGIAKPDPAPYHEAVKRAGGERGASVMIGDSATDIATAKAAGAPVIAVSFGYTDTHVSAFDPDHVVDHFDEVWGLLE